MSRSPLFPGDETQRVGNSHEGRVLGGESETGQNSDGDQQVRTALLIPDLQQIKQRESDGGYSNVVIGDGSVDPNHRARVKENCASHTHARVSNPAAVGEHQEGQAKQKGVMHQSGGGVFAE